MKRRPSPSTNTRRFAIGKLAFTLVEMLIVITIIALLIGVLLPALAAARRRSRGAVCVSHLRQWGVAVNNFATDNESFLPRRGQGVQETTQLTRAEDWFNALPPLMNMETYTQRATLARPVAAGESSVWACPAATAPATGNFFAYGMNMRLSTYAATLADRIDRVAPMSAQVFMADGPGTHCSILPSNQDYSLVARHDGRANIVFLDGHAATFAGETVGCGVGDPQRNDVQWIVPGSAWPGP